ncbi:hypothetical protein MLP_31110 [Microlunatus phosphovorus NM-1]|uniref:Uncharacterized protein n=1 Tax=Microlunatus phosphovorus (strain ATCC 700054 / DSM 10555 / JCM 9379 / NBRC 101784 / NCIMB 13414 / VKM Ac-1990 / NM-1) TaxID=1032480 RepID=F5XKQ3_MICPN|nr:hypothetical protein MLP_31110 [Microlunatus phosphovorus NM-1]
MNSLVPRAKSDWSSLRHEYEGATSASRNPPDFKKWLTATYNVSFRDEDILRATRDLTRVPDEIERLATKISELGDRPPLI